MANLKRKTNVIGLRIQYFKYVICAVLISAIMLLLPLVKDEAKGFSILWLVGTHTIYKTLVAELVLLVILSVVFLIKPGKLTAYCEIAVAAAYSVNHVIVLLGTKRILAETTEYTGSFMVKDFSFAFWISFVSSVLILYMAMKTAKVHTGYILLVIMSVIWLFPVLWIVLTALREESGYYVGYFIPKGFTLNNFKNLFSDTSLIHFGKWWLNTLFVAACNCLTTTIIVLMTAYALSKTRFSGRMTFMKIMLIIGMFPGFMSMIAVYNILKGIGINQTLWALIIVNAAGAAMGYYIVKGFFDTIPKSLDEAALLDGATKWQIFTRITIPLSKSVIIYTVLMSFMGPWGDYIFPSMMLGDNQSQYTVALGLKWLTDFRRIDAYYTQFAAGALLVSLPIVIVFILLQRFYVEGMAGAVKG